MKLRTLTKFSIVSVLSISLFTVLSVSTEGGPEPSRTLLQSIGKGLGEVTAGLLVIGFSYVILNRFYVLIRTYVSKEENPDLIKQVQEFYTQYRKPIFLIHVSINTFAIIVAIIHGSLVLIRNPLQADLGWLAVIIMVASSVSGYIMWLKIRPLWDSKDIRTLIRASHRQWLFTIALVTVLFFHVILSEFN